MYRELFDFVPDVEFEIDRILDCGESVVVIGRQRGTMRQAMFDQVLAAVIELRAGKITRTRSFESAEEALEAVGLSE
jgi:ketosteroid isomerase-like protein